MEIDTMLAIIAVAALCLTWAIVRIRRKVLAEDAEMHERIDRLARKRAEEMRAYAGDRDRRTRIDEFWRVPGGMVDQGIPASPFPVPPPPKVRRLDVDEHAADFTPARD